MSGLTEYCGEVESGRPGDHMSMGCSLEFILGAVDMDKYRASEQFLTDPKWFKLLAHAIPEGKLPPIDNHLNWITHLPGRPEHCGMDEVSICFAHSRNCFPTKNEDLTRMYQEGREQVNILAKFLKENIPGFEHSYLSYTGSLLGVRESRRIVGEYVLKTLDFARGERFADAVADTSHHYDLHNPDGPGNIKWAEEIIDGKVCYVSSHGGKGSWPPPGGYENMSDGWGRKGDARQFRKNPCDIPYRSLIPVKLENLIVAGRCLSSEFMAQAAARLILCCLNMGQAAGTAAALSLKDNVTLRKLDVPKLQAILKDERGERSYAR